MPTTPGLRGRGPTRQEHAITTPAIPGGELPPHEEGGFAASSADAGFEPRWAALPQRRRRVADPFADEEPLPDDAAELQAMVRSLLGVTRTQQMLLQQRSSSAETSAYPAAGFGDASFDGGVPGSEAGDVRGGWAPFILTLDGDAYTAELSRLIGWVDNFLRPTFAREVTATRPWCLSWPEHPEAVARLHALWLAYGQHLDEEAGPAGMAVWIRDILDHALLQLRAPDGPFAACATRAGSDAHRLLAPPEPTRWTALGAA